MNVNGIGSGPLSLQTPGLPSTDDTRIDGTGQASPVSAERMSRILAEMAKLNATPLRADKDLPAPPGAPPLTPPTRNFSADEAVLILGALQSKLTDSQVKTAKESIKIDAQRKEVLHQEAMKKLEEAAKKIEEANTMGIFNKIFSYIGKAIGVVASVIGCIAAVALLASGVGTAAGVALLTLSVVGLALSAGDLVMSVANEISQAHGGPDLTIHGLMAKGFTELLKAFGVDEKQAEMIGQIAASAVEVVVAVSLAIATSVAAFFTGGAAAAGTAAAIAKVCKTVGSLVNVANGVISTAGGALTVARSVTSYEATMAQADKLDIVKIIQKLQQQIKDNADRVQELVQKLDEGITRVSSIIASGGETRMQIARRMV